MAERLLEAARALALGAGMETAVADLHITLCFLGAVEEAVMPALTARAAAIQAAPFELEFDALAYWRQSRVLAATCSRPPAAAEALARELRAGARLIGLTPDERPLRPHVTLVRGLGGARAMARPPVSLSTAVPIAAQAFHLAQSASGKVLPRYQRLGCWRLQLTHR